MRNEDAFVLVEVSKLSLDDEFMRYEPSNVKQEKFKTLLMHVIQRGVKDFWRPKYDPAFDKNGTSIIFEPGKKPATGKCYDWWNDTAKKFMPKRYSRLGTKSEYVAFLGVLIKKLVDEYKWSVAKAWYAVCNDSRELGHYLNFEDEKHECEFTGSRCVCGFFDLVNTCKCLAEDINMGGFWTTLGYYGEFGYSYPLIDLQHRKYWSAYYWNYFTVGWIVLERGESENET